jgi:uncharacterized protein YceK
MKGKMKKIFTVLTLGLGLLLTGCSSAPHVPSPAEGYSGTAVIEKSYRNSHKTGCRVVVKLPNGQTDELRVGRRTQCTGWDQGKTIRINNGALVK